MGLRYCPSCSQEVIDAVDQCPNCGARLPQNTALDETLQAENDASGDQPIQPQFFAVSLLKLAVLSTFTFGLYDFYWFWRNWNRIRVTGEPDITPSLRAFFLLFYCYPCFIRIKLTGINRGISPPPPIGILAICYLVMGFAWKLPEPLWTISFLRIAFLLPIQSYVNRINAAALPGHDPNSRFSVWNWIVILVGSLIFILAMIGTFLPKQ